MAETQHNSTAFTPESWELESAYAGQPGSPESTDKTTRALPACCGGLREKYQVQYVADSHQGVRYLLFYFVLSFAVCRCLLHLLTKNVLSRM